MTSTPSYTNSSPLANSPQASVDELQAGWQTMATFDRAAAIRRVLDEARISRRELARRLKVDEGTVRRYLGVAELPEGNKQEIKSGASVAAVLRSAKESRELNERRQLQDEERETHGHSRRLAAEIVAWLASLSLCPADMERVVENCRYRLWHCHIRGELVRVQRSRLPLARINAACEPPKNDALLEIEHDIQWLLIWLVRSLPDYQIIDHALDMACQSYGPQGWIA